MEPKQDRSAGEVPKLGPHCTGCVSKRHSGEVPVIPRPMCAVAGTESTKNIPPEISAELLGAKTTGAPATRCAPPARAAQRGAPQPLRPAARAARRRVAPRPSRRPPTPASPPDPRAAPRPPRHPCHPLPPAAPRCSQRATWCSQSRAASTPHRSARCARAAHQSNTRLTARSTPRAPRTRPVSGSCARCWGSCRRCRSCRWRPLPTRERGPATLPRRPGAALPSAAPCLTRACTRPMGAPCHPPTPSPSRTPRPTARSAALKQWRRRRRRWSPSCAS
jgi:hypothetical protein